MPAAPNPAKASHEVTEAEACGVRRRDDRVDAPQAEQAQFITGHGFGEATRFSSAGVHACPHTFIGHPLDTNRLRSTKYFILLALPRGLEPLFSP